MRKGAPKMSWCPQTWGDAKSVWSTVQLRKQDQRKEVTCPEPKHEVRPQSPTPVSPSTTAPSLGLA